MHFPSTPAGIHDTWLVGWLLCSGCPGLVAAPSQPNVTPAALWPCVVHVGPLVGPPHSDFTSHHMFFKAFKICLQEGSVQITSSSVQVSEEASRHLLVGPSHQVWGWQVTHHIWSLIAPQALALLPLRTKLSAFGLSFSYYRNFWRHAVIHSQTILRHRSL